MYHAAEVLDRRLYTALASRANLSLTRWHLLPSNMVAPTTWPRGLFTGMGCQELNQNTRMTPSRRHHSSINRARNENLLQLQQFILVLKYIIIPKNFINLGCKENSIWNQPLAPYIYIYTKNFIYIHYYRNICVAFINSVHAWSRRRAPWTDECRPISRTVRPWRSTHVH